MSSGKARAVLAVLLLAAALSAACRGGNGVFKRDYEYEEELYLALDGTATVNVNASVAALVALRGADLDPDPRARLDRAKVRALFTAPGADVTRVSTSRRHGRRFVHVSVDVRDIRQLSRSKPFSWSVYRLERRGDEVTFRQVVGTASGTRIGDVGWNGRERVAFRMHLPAEIHNPPTTIERGNILEWEQPLTARLAGEPLDLQVTMAPETILYTTLMLFASTVVAALVTFAAVIWWVARRGRNTEMAESRP